ncbi:MAG: sugar ABC transporter ATP-binding protein [Spirochaetaceae bacterium]|nr:sugar ABC transporter ATP-binding protein [Spirochaetaceae bacterium]
MSENFLEIKNVSKAFGRNKVLDGINLTVRKGTVLGLMGENGAGKSTLVKCLFGSYKKDEGEIKLDGRIVDFKNPKDALENGVTMVHQELNLCLDMTVADNLFLGRFPKRMGMVSETEMYEKANNIFSQLKININPKRIVRTMAVAEKQMIEIAKAVSYNARLIVLDEPTSSLTEREVKKLFSIVEELKAKGVSFIYISHKMDEIFKVCDDVTVLRDGKMILTKSVTETTMDELITAMVGRSLSKRFPEIDNTPGEPYLTLTELTTKYEPVLKDISFSVKKGEIFGIYGLVGAGRSELLETLFGIRSIAYGDITIAGKNIYLKHTSDALACNFALLTEERKLNGMFEKASIEFNVTIANLKKYKGATFLSKQKLKRAADSQIKKMRVRCMSTEQLMSSLSGGNQQKVIIAKWLERSPDIFLMDEPTRGIDVGAKYEIYELIVSMAKLGKTIIVVSSEMPEILGITNRIAVMSNNRLSGIVETKETNQEELLKLSAKYL